MLFLPPDAEPRTGDESKIIYFMFTERVLLEIQPDFIPQSVLGASSSALGSDIHMWGLIDLPPSFTQTPCSEPAPSGCVNYRP